VPASTHHPEQAFACADEVAVPPGGELLRIGAPVEVVTAETLRVCYAVEVALLPVAGDRYRVCVPRSYLFVVIAAMHDAARAVAEQERAFDA
jgi:ABC-type cobalamin/Fe3+-siderophores transport system ATPase subunit